MRKLAPWIPMALLVLASGCQRKCQAPTTQAYRSLVDTQWRLVESTDPDVTPTLNQFNFLLFQFNRNATGAVNRVVNNDLYDQPVASLVWIPNVDQGMVRIQYSSVDPNSNTNKGDLGTFDYSYNLSNQLELHELKRGLYYRFVPFQGVVNPDTKCVF